MMLPPAITVGTIRCGIPTHPRTHEAYEGRPSCAYHCRQDPDLVTFASPRSQPTYWEHRQDFPIQSRTITHSPTQPIQHSTQQTNLQHSTSPHSKPTHLKPKPSTCTSPSSPSSPPPASPPPPPASTKEQPKNFEVSKFSFGCTAGCYYSFDVAYDNGAAKCSGSLEDKDYVKCSTKDKKQSIYAYIDTTSDKNELKLQAEQSNAKKGTRCNYYGEKQVYAATSSDASKQKEAFKVKNSASTCVA
ncbi:hypothetical protein Q7P37_006572 [Cladosporium fusiforme]